MPIRVRITPAMTRADARATRVAASDSRTTSEVKAARPSHSTMTGPAATGLGRTSSEMPNDRPSDRNKPARPQMPTNNGKYAMKSGRTDDETPTSGASEANHSG